VDSGPRLVKSYRPPPPTRFGDLGRYSAHPMSYGVVRGRLRFSKFGGALLAVTSVVAGCGDDGASDDGDVGDGGLGFASADPRGDGGAGGIDTQDLSVGLDTSQPPDNLSVGLESLGDAGVTDASAPATSEPTLDTSIAASSSEGSSIAPATSSVDVPTSEPSTLDASDTASSSNVDSSTAPPVDLFAEIVAAATWADLPATFAAAELPDVNLTLTWSVTSVPWESEVSDLDLSDSSATEVSFVPDVAGLYTLNLHVASGDASIDVEASVDVAMVDVAYLRVTNGPDGGYVYEPKMVPSDGTLEPVDVGCSFDTWAWEQRDTQNWRDALIYESQTLGFRYPREPGDETLFAYHYRADNNPGVTHVATVQSGCSNNRPVDLNVGLFPDFSPTALDLSRVVDPFIDDGAYPHLISSPVAVNTVVEPSSTYVAATDWWDEASIAWAGDVYDGEAYSPAIAISSITDEGYHTVLDCAQSRVPTPIFGTSEEFEDFDEIAVVPGGLMVLASSQLWYLPVLIADGRPYASCEYYDEANVLIATGVADFEVAPDGRTVALIARQYEGDELRAILGVGPVGETLAWDNAAWGVFDAGNVSDYYTGLHWIGGSQQLIWTAVQYIDYYEGGYGFTRIYDSSVSKMNADGTHRRTLVYNAVQEGYEQSVVTTGPIGLIESYYVGGS
jgi:hypothetical protein